MRLHDFLNTASTAKPAPTKPVSFRVFGESASASQVIAHARAQLVFIDEEERGLAVAAATKKCREKFRDEPIPDEAQSDEEAYEILSRAMRDADDARVFFAESTAQLKKALVTPVARDLYAEYRLWLEQEFPSIITNEEFAALVEEAKKKSLHALLSSSDSKKILRALPALGALLARFPMPTSGGGEPASKQ